MGSQPSSMAAMHTTPSQPAMGRGRGSGGRGRGGGCKGGRKGALVLDLSDTEDMEESSTTEGMF